MGFRNKKLIFKIDGRERRDKIFGYPKTRTTAEESLTPLLPNTSSMKNEVAFFSADFYQDFQQIYKFKIKLYLISPIQIKFYSYMLRK